MLVAGVAGLLFDMYFIVVQYICKPKPISTPGTARLRLQPCENPSLSSQSGRNCAEFKDFDAFSYNQLYFERISHIAFLLFK
jgi:hypothetical protein